MHFTVGGLGRKAGGGGATAKAYGCSSAGAILPNSLYICNGPGSLHWVDGAQLISLQLG